ncbi:MAG: macro domain-containing protein [Chloroflexota bacterium]
MNTVLAERVLPSGQIVQIVRGDITAERVDAIVNAANQYLQHGGGVAWAISEKGGPAIQKESDAWIREHGLVPHSHPAWTSGGRLPAKYVIHAVGPVWGDGDEDRKLAEAVNGSLRVADELHCASLAMPAISTGIFGFPKERAAKVILEAIENHFQHHPSSLQTVRIVLFDQPSVHAFLKQRQGREAEQA